MSQEEDFPQRFYDADQEPEQILTPISGYEQCSLVSLKESIAPVKSLLYNSDLMIQIVLKNSEKPADGLTQDESASIHLYTMHWPYSHPSIFQLLNEKLRSEDRDSLIPWFSFLKLFLTALYKLPSYRGTIWRGVKGNLFGQYNAEHYWWGLSSCTETMSKIKKFMGNDNTKTIFSIECFTGKAIESHSYFKKENEILLLPGSYFQVIDKMKITNDLFIIHLREKNPPFQTLTPPFSPHSLEFDWHTISSRNQTIPNNNTLSSNSSDQTNLDLQIVSPTNEGTTSTYNSKQNNLIQSKTNNLSNICKELFCFPCLSRSGKVNSIKTKFNENAKTIAGGDVRGHKLNQLSQPYGIFIDKYKNIYLADFKNHRIVRWKSNRKQGQIIAGGNGKGNRIDQLHYPTDVLIDQQNDSIIITDQENRRVIRWLNQNHQEILIENIDCHGLAMDKFGFLYVSDREKHEVRRWKIEEKGRESTLVAGGNGKGNQLSQLSFPTYIFLDDEQSLYVSDSDNHRVMKWKKYAREGVIVVGGKGKGDNLNQLSVPKGLYVDQWKQIYVADSMNHRIMRWIEGQKKGEIVVGGNREGHLSNQFYLPEGLSFDSEGNLYVVDCENDRIQKFEIISS